MKRRKAKQPKQETVSQSLRGMRWRGTDGAGNAETEHHKSNEPASLWIPQDFTMADDDTGKSAIVERTVPKVENDNRNWKRAGLFGAMLLLVFILVCGLFHEDRTYTKSLERKL